MFAIKVQDNTGTGVRYVGKGKDDNTIVRTRAMKRVLCFPTVELAKDAGNFLRDHGFIPDRTQLFVHRVAA